MFSSESEDPSDCNNPKELDTSYILQRERGFNVSGVRNAGDNRGVPMVMCMVGWFNGV